MCLGPDIRDITWVDRHIGVGGVTMCLGPDSKTEHDMEYKCLQKLTSSSTFKVTRTLNL